MVSREQVDDQARQANLESEGYVNLQIKSLQETINGELQKIMAVAVPLTQRWRRSGPSLSER